jgi:hypothetical protein
MSSKSFNVSVEPAVLIWARESIGLSVDDVVKKISGVTINTIKRWETKGSGIVRGSVLVSSFYICRWL